jgi:hypothetical protein
MRGACIKLRYERFHPEISSATRRLIGPPTAPAATAPRAATLTATQGSDTHSGIRTRAPMLISLASPGQAGETPIPGSEGGDIGS